MTARVILLDSGRWAGWFRWVEPQDNGFLAQIGTIYTRADPDAGGYRTARVALETGPSHANRMGALHGGFMAAFADHAFFAGLAAMGSPEHAYDGVTIDLTIQYLSAGRIGLPVEAQVELLRETGRMFFMRMVIAQEGQPVASSTATIRKAVKPS